MRNVVSEDSSSSDSVAISATWRIPFRDGTPDTTMYASPIVSTWTYRSKHENDSFRKEAVGKVLHSKVAHHVQNGHQTYSLQKGPAVIFVAAFGSCTSKLLVPFGEDAGLTL